MDLTKFKERYPEFLLLMQKKGYKSRYIKAFERIARLILDEGEDDSINTYEQFYYHMIEYHNYTEGTGIAYRNLIGRLKAFIEDGIFLGDTGKTSGFLNYNSYDLLSPGFKYLIDSYVEMEQKRGKLKNSSIVSVISSTSSFLYYIQQSGIMVLSEIKNAQIVLQAFEKGEKRYNSYSASQSISTVLKKCSHLYPGGECHNVLGMIPEFPKRYRLYDYLQPEEIKLIITALESDRSKLTFREKAVGRLAYYTGMRRIDIANLQFKNISLERDEISFEQQKTGLVVNIPLRPVVGNAIYDYIINERPQTESDFIFIRTIRPFNRLTASGMERIANNIFREANIRQEKGRRKGLNLFRHAFASDLIAKDVSNNVVSNLMGHASLKSLNPYLDADIDHLRACALSISTFAHISGFQIKPFLSFARKALSQFVEYNINQGTWCSDYNIMVHSLDDYLIATQPNSSTFSQGMFNQWCIPLTEESRKAYLQRMNAVGDFISYLSSNYSSEIEMPKIQKIGLRKRTPLDKSYMSIGSKLLCQFVNHRKKSGRWSAIYDRNLRSFDNHCSKLYPKATALTQEMVDTWCTKRESESSHSWGKRIAVVNSFLKFTSRRGLLLLEWKIVPTHGPENMVINEPHVFTDVELNNFFYACDHIKFDRCGLLQRLMITTIPAIFRLLYSTGMRTNEARNLCIEDVDLKHGIINIRHTKGYMEHRIALHPTMRDLLIAYNTSVNKLMPDRTCFFPNFYDKPYSISWMDYNFNLLWFKYNQNEATPYHFRHHYATTNINIWPAQSEKFNRNLLYLSRSMGHSTLETTMYYYHYTPKLAEILKDRKAVTFNEIISNHTQNY